MSSTAENQTKRSPVKQLALLLLFGCAVGSIFVFRHFLPGSTDTERLDRQAALARYHFCLEEVSRQCGIDFVHQAPAKLDRRLDHIMPIIVSMGASVSVVDFDRDGLPDLYVVTSIEGGKNRLYHNLGNGKFEDVAEQMGVADLNQEGTGVCMGAVWGDYDNDGYEDLLVYKWGRPELYHNDKGKGFTRVANAGLPDWVNANSAIWLDYDNDGKLDLLIAGYWPDEVNLWKLTTTRIMPESFQFARNGGRKYLLRNRGDGTFENVSEKVGLTGKRWTLSVAAADLHGNGYPDLVFANDYGVNEFYTNLGGKKFVERGRETRVGDQSKSGMSVGFGDVYNQGRFAVYTTNISQAGILLQGNNLWVPQRRDKDSELTYENQAGTLGVELGGWSWGAQFGDLNNDGLVDLILTNGYVSTDSKEDYWYDYSLLAGANNNIIEDAANWPPMKGRSLAGRQRHCLWLNHNGKFDDVATAVGFNDTFDGRSIALVDLWNRGVLDVVVANQKGPLLVYKNTVAPDHAWAQFELTGTRSNRSAIGAQVKLYWNGKTQVQEVSGGNGYASQNQRRLHFGLGKNPRVERAVIRWPSGRTQTIPAARIQVGALNKITEES
jgi:hypothetical protein